MNAIKTNVTGVNFGKIAGIYAIIATIYAVATATFASIMVNTIGNSFDPGLSTNMLTGSSWFLVFIGAFIQAAIFLVVFTVIGAVFGTLGYKFYDKLDSTTKITVEKFAKYVAIAINLNAVFIGGTAAMVIYKAAAFAKLGALATAYVTGYSFVIGLVQGYLVGTIFTVVITFIGTMFLGLAGVALSTKKSTSATTAATEEPKDSETPKE
jgi:hypothetical protein